MEAVRLDPAHKNEIVEMYTRAFFDYPEFVFYFPDPVQRKTKLKSIMGIVVDYGKLYGHLFTTPELSGGVCFIPPGFTEFTLPRLIRSGYLTSVPFKAGVRDWYTRILTNELFMEKIHNEIITRPHFYLWALAVDPACQGQGIGKALMKPGFEMADRQGVPIYLETHDEKNVAYYQHHGFDLKRIEFLPRYGLKFWCMVREPQKG